MAVNLVEPDSASCRRLACGKPDAELASRGRWMKPGPRAETGAAEGCMGTRSEVAMLRLQCNSRWLGTGGGRGGSSEASGKGTHCRW